MPRVSSSWVQPMSHFIPSYQFPWAVSSSNRRVDRVGGYGTVLPGQSCVQSQSRDLAERRSLEPEAHPQPGSDGSLLMKPVATVSRKPFALGCAWDRCLCFPWTLMPPHGAACSPGDLRGFSRHVYKHITADQLPWCFACSQDMERLCVSKKGVNGEPEAGFQQPRSVMPLGTRQREEVC